MDFSKLNRIINIIREDIMSTDPGGTSKPGFSSSAEKPVAGFDPVMDLRRKYGKKLNLFYRKRLGELRDVNKQRHKN